MKYKNSNSIDGRVFPPHLTLLTGGTDKESLYAIAQLLAAQDWNMDDCSASPADTSEGFLSIPVRSNQLRVVQEDILKNIEPIISKKPFLHPRVLEKWDHLSSVQKERAIRYGTYKIAEDFHPHISIAKVEPAHQYAALAMARESIQAPMHMAFDIIQLVDVGHKNEKWEIIAEYPLGE